MGVMSAAAAGATVGAGLLLVVLGLIPRERSSTARSTALWATWSARWAALPRAHRIWALTAVAAGVVAAVVTGWLVALILVPAALIIIPLLLTAPPNREVDLLAGLDRWVRLVATSLTSGKSIRDAIFATRHQAPPVLREPIAHLCTRLDQRWTVRDALFRMADDLASPDADAVVAAMTIAATRGGAGARATLEALSNTMQDRLRALREIAAERAKPRAVVRQVTVITLAVLALMLMLSRGFFEPYATPLGQVIAVALAAAYLGCLLMLRRMTVPPMGPRFLRSEP